MQQRYENLVRLRPLQTLAESLRAVEGGRAPDSGLRRRATRSVREAGPAAVPLLVRALRADAEPLAHWAYFLLARLGGPRVVAAMQSLLRDPAIADAAKGLALALLSELEAPAPAEITLQDPDAVIARSVRDLVRGLRTSADVRQAADLVVAQVPEAELAFFCQELLKHGGRRARSLVRAIGAATRPGATAREIAELVERSRADARAERTAALLLEGIARLEQGDPEGAAGALARFVRRHPDHAEGQSTLGVCLLELGRPLGALAHLESACRLEPDEGLHHWNLAAAAQKTGRVGRCYLALLAYLGARDEGPGADERKGDAAAYVAEYDRATRLDHPGVDPERVALGEGLFLAASAALEARNAAEAAAGFQDVLALVPGHYASWANLGRAYQALGRRDEAMASLRRALELRPDYEPARRNLRELAQPPVV